MRDDTHMRRCAIMNITKDRPPRLPFFAMKNAVLGERYELSIVFVGNAVSRRLNRQYRKKNKPANVLSFRLEKHIGELFIDLTEAKKEAQHYTESVKNRAGLLLIHGLLHLKGFTHGSTMNVKEVKMRKKFNLA